MHRSHVVSAWDRAVTQVNGIAVWAEGIKAELAQRLPRQRKTQRDKLAVLVATMLHVRSANLVEVAAGLPRASDRWDMGYQWISRFLANGLVCCDDVMAPFDREILAWLAESGEPIPLILDQTKASDHHQILMLSVRWGERALPLAWRVAETEGAIGFTTQQELLEVVAGWLPVGQAVILLGDRFYGTPEMMCGVAIADGTIGCGSRATSSPAWGQQGPRLAHSPCPAATISRISSLPASGSRPTSASSAILGIPSPGSSPCRPSRDISPPWDTPRAGASSPCSRISNRAGLVSNRPICAIPTVSPA